MEKVPVPSLARRHSGIFRPMHFVALAAIALLALTGTVLTTQVDRSDRLREERMVEAGFSQRIDEIAAAVVPQVDWDDAVVHVGNRFDPAWIDRNLATYLHALNGVTGVFVLDGEERVTYAAGNGKRTAPDAFTPYAASVRAQLPAIRAAEAARPRFAPRASGIVAEPIQSRTITYAAGRLDVVVVSLVQPDFGTALPRRTPAPVVVTVVPFDDVAVARFAARYELDDVHLSPRAIVERGWAQAPLRDQSGRPIAWLVWRDRAPGQSLMFRLLTPLLCLLTVLGMISDMFYRRSAAIASDLIASEARARHLAYHDTLTQLPNRAMMFERLRRALSSARRRGTMLAVHCLDLDRFKEINDALGHQAGDELIGKVADILGRLCRDTDTVARLGGDEFVVIQPDTTAVGSAQLADRILQALRRPIALDFGPVEISVSIGTTLVGEGEIDPNEVLRQADLALHDAKEKGRDRITFFEPEMDAAMKMRRELEVELRKALQDQALEMVYQPQSDQRGTITGLESLVRWPHPRRGLVPPAMFVPLAEESGLIYDLGEFVFRRVFEETRGWQKKVAINVSALQLRSPEFMSMLSRLVAEFRVDPARYEIEITETALLGDDGVTRGNIDLLKQQGFTIALDDFGTGYSSLSTLQRFKVDKIKIDRSFVRNLEVDAEADALVDAIVHLGQALDLKVIAEGVETENQRARLVSCGCTIFQGYLISRPIAMRDAALIAA
ncbi:MAG: EAL domain-containing protein [Sphingomonadales bacterium]|nr:EAL domain-containing protein [Sphingomonadales bacterium]